MCSNTNGSSRSSNAGVVRYELTADGDGTLLRFTHRGLGAPNATGFRAGTHAYLDRLEAYLAGGALPNWAQRVCEITGSADHEGKIMYTTILTCTPGPGDRLPLRLRPHPTSQPRWRTAPGRRRQVERDRGGRDDRRGLGALDGADGIIFGSATYMGNVSAGFQAFAEKTGRRCLTGRGGTRSPPVSPTPAPRAATSCPR